MKNTVNTIENFRLTYENYEKMLHSKTMTSCEKSILLKIISEQQLIFEPTPIKYDWFITLVSRNTIVESCKRLKARGLIKVRALINGTLEEVEQVDERYETLYYSLQLDTLEKQNFITLHY